MLALALILLVAATMWVAQTLSLLSVGRPVRLCIDHGDLPRWLQGANRVVTNAAFAAVLLAYPAFRGESPLHYYGRFFPLGDRPAELAHGIAAALIYLGLLYAAWLFTGNIHLRVQSHPGRLIKRLMGVPFTAVIGAGVEELLFRAMLMAGLMEWLGTIPAVVIGTIVFAGAHYVRRVKRYWTFPGHLALGMMLCVAFACTDALWLPLGLHAGGILIIMGLRPLVRYVGPPWMVGASIFPYAGLVGVIGLTILTYNMYFVYGVAR